MKNEMFENEETYKKILGPYLGGRVIDTKKGSYGIVYIVDQGKNALPRYIAYKTIIKTLEKEIEEEKLKNFVREARQWFKVIGHPLVLSPFYITYFRGLPLICMPFCEMDLQTYLEKQKKLDLTETLMFTAQILNGLMIAKRNGIEAHQDLKPGNILLDVDPSLRFMVRIADFGLANAWKELGRPQGTLPYMAPEQYAPQEYKKFSPDIFAVGVIMTEMLTGRHPSGKSIKAFWNWKPKKREQWAKTGKRNIEIGDDENSKEIETLITKMLLPNPQERPSLEDAFSKIMDILSKINKPKLKELEFAFKYFDACAGYFEYEFRLGALVQLSRLPGQLDIIIDELFNELSIAERNLNDPRDVVYFCRLCYTTSKLLLERGKDDDKGKVKHFAEQIISVASKWKEEIKIHCVYPESRVDDTCFLVVAGHSRDFGIYAEIINYGKTLLENVIGVDKTEIFFIKRDTHTQSAYFYNIASDFCLKGDEKKAVEVLDKCIRLNPTEAVLYFIKALWTGFYFPRKKTLGKLESREKTALRKVILENTQKALEIDPGWEEPRKILKCVRKLMTLPPSKTRQLLNNLDLRVI